MQSGRLAIICSAWSVAISIVACTRQQVATTASASKVAGSAWYHTSNLLQNPAASSSTVNPPWTQAVGWTVQTGPVTVGSSTVDAPDGTPWFLNGGGVNILNSCASCCNSRSATLAQTINLTPYAGLLQTHITYFVYGGDAFATSHGTGTGSALCYRRGGGPQATFSLTFFDSNGVQVAYDTSGDLFAPNSSCIFPLGILRSNAGYRRTVTAVPATARSVRFTATVTDMLCVCCSNSPHSASFRNGFDNLWLDLAFWGPSSASQRFQRGDPPGPWVNATINKR